MRSALRVRCGPGAALLIFALGLAAAAAAQAPSATLPAAADLQPVPKLTARVTDLTGTLTAGQQNALEQKLAAFESAKGSQLAVLIVPTTAPEDVFQYSFRVADTWKLGRKEAGGKSVDDGVLLLVAKNDRNLWIQVGTGLEGVLTDAICSRIISETLRPAFRQANYYAGIDAALDQMISLIQGEPLPPPEEHWQPGRHGRGGGLLPFIFFAVLAGSVVLRGIFGRTLGSLLTGIGAGLLTFIAGYAIALAVLAAIGGFILTLLGGLSGASGWSSASRYGGLGGGWGGFGGGLGGGGFGGGGFSGGGGGFSGGGAGGSW